MSVGAGPAPALRVSVDGSALASPWSSMAIYARELLSAMLEVRPESRFTVYTSAAGLVDELLGREGVEGARLPETRLVGRHLLWPARLARDRSSAFFGINGYLPLGHLLLPAVITVHDLAIYRHPEWFPAGQPLSTRMIVPRSLRRADAVIAISENTATDLRELFDVPAGRIHVVHSGVSPAYHPIGQEVLEGVRDELGLQPGFVLFVGTVQPRKNVETLVRAWAGLEPRPQLVIAGGYGWKYAAVQQLVESYGGSIRVLGPVQPALLPALYNLAGCLGHLSWYEGFGLTPLEAMACGTPVVCSNRSSLPEVVGDAAVLVDPADMLAAREALARVLADSQLRQDLAERGIEQARSFSWTKSAQESWAVFDSLSRSQGSP